MVRLKAARNLERERVGLRFNSKMVRLKALRDRDYKTASEMFQFQNGTIKRCNFILCGERCTHVSIPKWYD